MLIEFTKKSLQNKIIKFKHSIGHTNTIDVNKVFDFNIIKTAEDIKQLQFNELYTLINPAVSEFEKRIFKGTPIWDENNNRLTYNDAYIVDLLSCIRKYVNDFVKEIWAAYHEEN